MYLSRIKLDTRKRATMIALSNPQQFHGAIETALGVDNERSAHCGDWIHWMESLVCLS